MQIVEQGLASQYALYKQWLQDHFVSSYSLSLRTVAKALSVQLPIGQDLAHVETVALHSGNAKGRDSVSALLV